MQYSYKLVFPSPRSKNEVDGKIYSCDDRQDIAQKPGHLRQMSTDSKLDQVALGLLSIFYAGYMWTVEFIDP